MNNRPCTARLIARLEQVDLSPADLDTLLNLVQSEYNRLTAQMAWRDATEPQRRRMSSLQQRLVLIREQLDA